MLMQCVLKSMRRILLSRACVFGCLPGHPVGFHTTASSTARSRAAQDLTGRAIPQSSPSRSCRH